MKRKILTTVLVVVLAFAMITPTMAQTWIPEVGDNLGEWNPGESMYVRGDGDVIRAEIPGNDRALFSFPTGVNLDFIIDPMGLFDEGVGNVVDPEDRNPEVIFHPDKVIAAINNSTAPVVFSVVPRVTGDSTSVTSIGAVPQRTDGTGNLNSLFWLEPSQVNVQTVPTARDNPAFNGAGNGIPFTHTSGDVSFLLNEHPSRLVVGEVEGTGWTARVTRIDRQLLDSANQPIGDPTTADNGHGTRFELGGLINPYTNGWTATTDVGITLTWAASFIDPRGTTATLNDAIAFGWLEDGDIAFVDDAAGNAVTVESYTAPELSILLADVQEVLDEGFPEATIGFIVNGEVESSRGDLAQRRGLWFSIPFRAPGSSNDDFTVSASTAAGAAADPADFNFVDDTELLWFQWAANAAVGYRQLTIQVDGNTFTVWINITA